VAAYLKYEPFVGSLADAQINAVGATDTFKVVIHTDNAALSTASVTTLSQILSANGYPGSNTLTYTCSPASGTVTFISGDITWTATGGNLGNSTSGRYFSIYDDTPTTPIADPLMCKFDYGASFTVATGETMTLDCDPIAGLFTLN
jgi:hypothetical protein